MLNYTFLTVTVVTNFLEPYYLKFKVTTNIITSGQILKKDTTKGFVEHSQTG